MIDDDTYAAAIEKCRHLDGQVIERDKQIARLEKQIALLLAGKFPNSVTGLTTTALEYRLRGGNCISPGKYCDVSESMLHCLLYAKLCHDRIEQGTLTRAALGEAMNELEDITGTAFETWT